MIWLVRTFFLFAIFARVGYAAPMPVYIDAGQGRYPLREQIQVLEDPQRNLTLSDVTSDALAWRWQQAPKGSISYGYSSSAYWFTFSLQGAPRSEWLLEIDYPMLDQVEMTAQTTDAKPQYFKTGDHYPTQSRPIFHRNFVLPIKLGGDGAARVYLRVESTSTLRIPLTLWHERALYRADQSVLIAESVYYGIVAAMLLYNFFIFLVIRDRSYLYYVGTLAFIALFLSSFHGVLYQFIWSEWMPIWWNDRVTAMTASLASLFVCLFSAQFLDLKEKYPAWWWFFMAFAGICAFAFISVLVLPYAIAIPLVVVLCLLTDIFALIAGYYMWRRGQPSAVYFVIAWTALLGGAITLGLNILGVLPNTFWSDRAFQIGSALDAILLSFALAHRLRVLRDENFKMQRFVTEQLEQTVQDKQVELELNYARLHELERERLLAAERERIMRDMHDGVGGSLVSALTLMERKGARRETVIQSLRDALEDLRLMIASLNPSGEALVPSLGMLRRRLETRLHQSGMALEWQLHDLPGTDHFGPERVLHVMRLVQEAATNAVTHSGGHRLSVRTGTERYNGSVRCYIEIADDGRGISHKRTLGRGLRNMQRRAELVGGDFELFSSTSGTRVRLWLPAAA